MELFNEFCLLTTTYCYLLFTQYNLNKESKNIIGWICIFLTILNLVINFLVILVNGFFGIKQLFKKFIAKRIKKSPIILNQNSYVIDET